LSSDPTGNRDRVKTQTDATALCRGDSRSRLQWKVSSVCGCHGLVPWTHAYYWS